MNNMNQELRNKSLRLGIILYQKFHYNEAFLYFT